MVAAARRYPASAFQNVLVRAVMPITATISVIQSRVILPRTRTRRIVEILPSWFAEVLRRT
jgi:hypothetical protein